jgi:hypothetical protein
VDLELSREVGAFVLALGARYERWSAFDGWLGATVECPPARAACGTRVPAPPGYSDVVVPRLAASYRFELAPLALVVRAGYTYAPSPIREQTGSKDELDAGRHGLGAGYGVWLPPALVPLRLEAAFRLDVLSGRSHDKPVGPPLTTRGSALTVCFGAGVEL